MPNKTSARRTVDEIIEYRVSLYERRYENGQPLWDDEKPGDTVKNADPEIEVRPIQLGEAYNGRRRG